MRPTRLDVGRQTAAAAFQPATIEPDQTCPGLWRVRLPGGHLTDTVNLSRAKDAAASLALGVLNRHREAA